MTKAIFPRNLKFYIPLAIIFVVMLVSIPRTGRFNYDYQKGSVWMYEDIVAEFSFPLLKTPEQISQEQLRKSSEIIPYFALDASVSRSVLNEVKQMPMGSYSYLRKGIVSICSRGYAQGVIKDKDLLDNDIYRSGVLYIQSDNRSRKVTISSIESIPELNREILAYISTKTNENADSLYAAFGLAQIIVSNLSYDAATTELVHKNILDAISPTCGLVTQNTKIVSKGDLVTDEIVQMLDSYKAEYNRTLSYKGNPIWLWVGNGLLCLMLVALLFVGIIFTQPQLLEQYNKYCFALFVFALSAEATLLIMRWAEAQYLFLCPYTIVAIYLLQFLRKRQVTVLYILSLLPLPVFADAGADLMLIFLCGGLASIVSFARFDLRTWGLFINAAISFCVMALMWFGTVLVRGAGNIPFIQLGFLAISCLLTVFVYPFSFLLEPLFKLVSSSRLISLSDPSSPLLQDLNKEAPGTFQHTLQVSTMAEAIAHKIGADYMLTKVGALYHDIGKIKNPACFTENNVKFGDSYHKDKTPLESVEDVIDHVSDGEEMASEKHLPSEIKDFISTHHGTTCVMSFYNQYLNNGGSESKQRNFCYNGPRPKTREQAIVMLCDSVEAASRSMSDFSEDSVRTMVETILDGKNEEHQFSECDISLKDFNSIKEELIAYVLGNHHKRINYPKRKNN